ncbi:MAG: 4Fe-4S binding protein, partial [Hyphomicrobiaceae bacterium]
MSDDNNAAAPDQPQVPTVLVCNCDRTMEIDAAALAKSLADVRGTSDELPVFNQLCRQQIAGYEAAIESGAPVLVACTQEAPLFAEIAAEKGVAEPLFTNIRERAGWCENKVGSTAKMAALLADALHENRPAEQMTITSEGTCLVYGPGQQALDAAGKLASRLSVTALLTDPAGAIPPGTADVPIYKGTIANAAGALGNFEVVVDGYAPIVPSSRRELAFMMERDGAASKCDIILDLSGNTPLFSDTDRHDGYFHVDPSKPGDLADALFAASDLVGEFEKPLYVRYDANICAHGRSGQTGCSNCLDNCPVSAITPTGDTVEINPLICGGCGSCSSSCPTGAVSYAYPDRADIVTRAQKLITAYSDAGGKNPVILFHDGSHGAPLISAMARFGHGLPVNVLPVSLYTATQLGHEVMAGILASGAEHVVVLAPNTRRDELAALRGEVDLTNAVLSALGTSEPRTHLLVEDDPDKVEEALYGLEVLTGIARSVFTPSPQKRETARLAFAALHENAA